MKKKTNKILWTSIIVAIVALLTFITIDFQVSYHHHPDKLKQCEVMSNK